MKEYYLIGETAKLLGVTTQTLRFYDKIDLIKPVKIDEQTGYRYYSYRQFHYIDRTKYLQSMGMPLDDIREVIHSGKVDKLLPFLQTQKDELNQEMNQLKNSIENVEWYMEYFTHMNQEPYQIHATSFPKRYILEVPTGELDTLSDLEIQLAKKKSSLDFGHEVFLRQYGYKISYEDFMSKIFSPKSYFIYVKNSELIPAEKKTLLHVLPAGEYLCFCERVLEENWEAEVYSQYIKEALQNKGAAIETASKNKTMETLMLALEYEDNLKNFEHARYELQIFLG